MSLGAGWRVLQRKRRGLANITGYVKEQILLTSLCDMMSGGSQANMLTNDVVNTRALLQSSALATLLCLNAVFLCLCLDKITMSAAVHCLPDSDIQHAECGTVNSRLAPRS